MPRLERVRASRITLEIVSWTIGVAVMAGLTFLAVMICRHLDWPWP